MFRTVHNKLGIFLLLLDGVLVHADLLFHFFDNFDLGADLIRFESAAGGFGALGIGDFNGDAAVSYGPGDVILLTGINSLLLNAGHFEFV